MEFLRIVLLTLYYNLVANKLTLIFDDEVFQVACELYAYGFMKFAKFQSVL